MSFQKTKRRRMTFYCTCCGRRYNAVDIKQTLCNNCEAVKEAFERHTLEFINKPEGK